MFNIFPKSSDNKGMSNRDYEVSLYAMGAGAGAAVVSGAGMLINEHVKHKKTLAERKEKLQEKQQAAEKLQEDITKAEEKEKGLLQENEDLDEKILSTHEETMSERKKLEDLEKKSAQLSEERRKKEQELNENKRIPSMTVIYNDKKNSSVSLSSMSTNNTGTSVQSETSSGKDQLKQSREERKASRRLKNQLGGNG